MNLQTILYGEFTPPLEVTTRKHRIMYDGKGYTPYTPSAYVPPKPNLQRDTTAKLLKLIGEHPGICTNELSEMTGRAKSYVYRMLIEMRELNMVVAVRGKPPRRGGPMTTLYYLKGTYAG